MLRIRLLTQIDIDYVSNSVQREGWRHLRRDVERCWRFEPNGCFIVEVQHKPVGHVFTTNYGKIGWIGLLIVNPENRDKGIGATLMHKAIHYLQEAGAETILLEAAEKAVPLYKRLGFREEFDSLRLSKQLQAREKPTRNGEQETFHILEEALHDIAKFDSKYFGANRLRVLKSLYQDQPQQCFIAKEKQKISGYIMSRKIQNALWIGPFVCENSETAERLLKTCIDTIAANTETRLGIPVLNTNGIRLMRNQGFLTKSKSVRMFFGKHKHLGDITRIYGIGGAEKG